MKRGKTYVYVKSEAEEDINRQINKISQNQHLILNEMEMYEVHRHAKTYGYIPEFNSIRFNV